MLSWAFLNSLRVRARLISQERIINLQLYTTHLHRKDSSQTRQFLIIEYLWRPNQELLLIQSLWERYSLQYLSIIAGLTKNVGLMNIMKEVYIKTNQAAANVTGSVTKQFLIPFIFLSQNKINIFKVLYSCMY